MSKKSYLQAKDVWGWIIHAWQLCRTICPLLSQRFPLASAKAQPRGDFEWSFQPCGSFATPLTRP